MNPQAEALVRTELRAATQNFITLWRTESEAALGQVHAPAGEATSAYAWISLAGNVIWASTSLMAPEATVAIRVMSFAGSGVPALAGLQQVYQSPDPTEDNIRVLRRAISLNLAAAADAINVDTIVNAAFAVCDRRNLNETRQAGERERLLWGFVFSTPYDGRRQKIQRVVLDACARIVAVAVRLSARYESEMAARGLQMVASAYASYGISIQSALMGNPIAVTQQVSQAPATARIMFPFNHWLAGQEAYCSLMRTLGMAAPPRGTAH